jgi:hypothetical protein
VLPSPTRRRRASGGVWQRSADSAWSRPKAGCSRPRLPLGATDLVAHEAVVANCVKERMTTRLRAGALRRVTPRRPRLLAAKAD